MSVDETQPTHGRVPNRFPVLSTIFGFGVIAFGLAAALADQSRLELSLLALASLVAGLLVIPFRSRAQSFQFTETGLKLETGTELSWNDLTDCTINDWRSDPADLFSGRVVAHFGNKVIPLNCRDAKLLPGKLYERLWDIILLGYQPDLRPPLLEIYQNQTNKHTAEKVIAARWVKQAEQIPQIGRFVVALGVFCAIAVLAACLVDQPMVSIIMATTSVIILASVILVWAIDRAKQNSSRKFAGGIILSPSGLSLKIPKLQGEMKWSELKGIELRPNSKKPKTLCLKLEGIQIDLTESFALPLWFLYRNSLTLLNNYRRESEIANQEFNSTNNANVVEDNNPYRAPQH